jgi:hypothetical protein
MCVKLLEGLFGNFFSLNIEGGLKNRHPVITLNFAMNHLHRRKKIAKRMKEKNRQKKERER